VGTLQWIVLFVASGIALVGILAVAWRELSAPAGTVRGGRGRLMFEVLLPVTGLIVLIVWLWTG
jgi:hypothetical protein